MKKYIIGGIVGAVIASSTMAFADSVNVSALLQTVNFSFNGHSQSAEVLNYNNKLYVPARLVGEGLGAKVGWDGGSQTASFSTGASGATNTAASTPTPASDPAQPVGGASDTQDNVTVTVNSVSLKSDRTVFDVTVTNNGDTPVHLAQSLAQIVANGQQYNHTDSLSDLSMYDQKWNQDIQAGATQTGKVTLPAISSTDSVNLYLKVMQSGSHFGISNFQIAVPIK